MKKLLFTLSAIAILAACTDAKQENVKTETPVADTTDYSIIGKKALITYPEFKAEVEYLSDSSLHWKVTYNDGKVAEESEKISYKQLNDSQFFLNWIEKDGITVSQVIDPKQQKVTAFLSFNDPKSERGQRASNFLEGKFELIK